MSKHREPQSQIANIDFLSNLDNSVYNILVPIPAKPAKITPAIRCMAAYKAKRRNNAGRYTTNSSLIANKDNNNTYNRVYIPPAKAEEEEEGSSSDNNSVNGSTSDNADKGKGSGIYKRGKGALHCKDTLLYKRQHVVSYLYSPPSIPYADIYIYYV
ncbi:hypothetical protein P8C59_001200 [Phyllachora maydis]|uniref:Uncharacterized protein n=1 Tax=Phyllachora maydis TaxID=1825666 RepID=A0AAD9HZ35_9PEZI|nr:hypothetical protein P8C59_001200 [Phyllachora maydis]